MRISDWSSDVCSSDLEATRERAKNPPKPRWREVCETFHDYVLFMGNTGLRPDESARLELRDVKIVKDESTGERSEEHTSELQSLMRISYAVFCLTKKNN